MASNTALPHTSCVFLSRRWRALIWNAANNSYDTTTTHLMVDNSSTDLAKWKRNHRKSARFAQLHMGPSAAYIPCLWVQHLAILPCVGAGRQYVPHSFSGALLICTHADIMPCSLWAGFASTIADNVQLRQSVLLGPSGRRYIPHSFSQLQISHCGLWAGILSVYAQGCHGECSASVASGIGRRTRMQISRSVACSWAFLEVPLAVDIGLWAILSVYAPGECSASNIAGNGSNFANTYFEAPRSGGPPSTSSSTPQTTCPVAGRRVGRRRQYVWVLAMLNGARQPIN
ncbi:hypothetical protein GGX14DRAFT_673124 [Mycena pura]|uniref:Uncharacterized protein n=1 Tax=Mycena pura TaxID=153505 RepID=A0AAD6V0D3_9AGAR|nr:hypothetical protein GGX14DRAFT_673124 [Mycena pura]